MFLRMVAYKFSIPHKLRVTVRKTKYLCLDKLLYLQLSYIHRWLILWLLQNHPQTVTPLHYQPVTSLHHQPVMPLHHQPVTSLLANGLDSGLHSIPSNPHPCLSHRFSISSFYLVFGLPLVQSPEYHSVAILAHLLSCILATWPAHLQFFNSFNLDDVFDFGTLSDGYLWYCLSNWWLEGFAPYFSVRPPTL